MKTLRVGLLALVGFLEVANRLDGMEISSIRFTPDPSQPSNVTALSKVCYQNFSIIGLSASASTIDPCGNICLTWCSPDYSGVYPDYSSFVTSYFALSYSLDGYTFTPLATAAPTETSGCVRAEVGDTGRTFYFRIDAVGSYSSGGPMIAALTPQTLPSNRVTVSVRSAQPPVIPSFVANPSSVPAGQSSTLSWSSSSPGSLCGVAASIDNGIGAVPSSGQIAVRPQATTTYTLTVTGAGGSTSARTTVTVGSTCQTPGAPSFPVSSASLSSGQSYAASWSRPAGLTDGTYVLETSRSSGFSTLESSQTLGVAAGVITPAASATDYQLYARVKAVATCGSVGPYSLPLTLTVTAGIANFVVTQVAPFPTTARGSAAPSASIAFRNVGAQSGRLSFSSGAGWFTVSPTTLDLGPGASGAVTLLAAGAVAQSGSYSGALRATWSSQVIETPVTLTVTPVSTPDGSRAGMKAKASATTLVFSAPEGQNPASQQLTISLSQIVGSGPVYLVPTIGPGGAWLRLSNELSSPVPSGGSVTLTVAVDRSRRTAADGAPPLRTLLQVLPAGGQPPAGADTGDAAVIEIVDLVPPVLAPGSGRSVFQGLGIGLGQLEAAGTGADGLSFIVPVVVRTPGLAGATYLSDGWLRNLGSTAVPVELYYTPQDKDGLSDASVVKASLAIPASSTVRLSDLLGAYFQAAGTGQVELRSPSPSGLTLRTVVKSVTGDDPALRFETEVPTLPLGSGVALDEGEAMAPGVSEDLLQRTNLILAETTGRSVTTQVTLYGRDGTVVGSTTRQVPPYGKVQVNRIVNEVAPGTSLAGGSVGVRAIAGAGRVASIVTVIDNRSNSFSAVRGRALRPAAAERTGVTAATSAASPLAYILPSAVRTTGINNTQYKTSLFLTNGRPSVANLVLTYHYVDMDDGNNLKSAVKAWQILPRGTLFPEYGEDVLQSLFGVSNRSYGWIEMTGELEKVSNVYTEIRTQVDPADPGRGVKKAAVSGYFSTDPVVIGKGMTEHRFAGAEKTVQKRSNLALVETAGAPCDVKVRVYNPVAPGGVMAERTYSLRAKEYLAITDVFGTAGLQLGEGPFQNVEVTAEVINGNGRVVATVQVIDNEPRNPSIFVLSVPGPGDPTIGL